MCCAVGEWLEFGRGVGSGPEGVPWFAGRVSPGGYARLRRAPRPGLRSPDDGVRAFGFDVSEPEVGAVEGPAGPDHIAVASGADEAVAVEGVGAFDPGLALSAGMELVEHEAAGLEDQGEVGLGQVTGHASG